MIFNKGCNSRTPGIDKRLPLGRGVTLDYLHVSAIGHDSEHVPLTLGSLYFPELHLCVGTARHNAILLPTLTSPRSSSSTLRANNDVVNQTQISAFLP